MAIVLAIRDYLYNNDRLGLGNDMGEKQVTAKTADGI